MSATTTLALTVSAGSAFIDESDPVGIGPTQNQSADALSIAYGNGAGAGNCDQVFAGIVNIPANTSVIVNLANNSQTDPLNLPVAAVRVKSVYLRLLAPTDSLQDGTVGTNCTAITMAGLNGAAGFIDGTTPKVRLKSGAVVLFADPGVGVTSGLSLNFSNEDLTNAAVVFAEFGIGKS